MGLSDSLNLIKNKHTEKIIKNEIDDMVKNLKVPDFKKIDISLSLNPVFLKEKDSLIFSEIKKLYLELESEKYWEEIFKKIDETYKNSDFTDTEKKNFIDLLIFKMDRKAIIIEYYSKILLEPEKMHEILKELKSELKKYDYILNIYDDEQIKLSFDF